MQNQAATFSILFFKLNSNVKNKKIAVIKTK